jgi:plastocyanin
MLSSHSFRALVIAGLSLAGVALAADEILPHRIEQKNRAFSITQLTIKVGEKIEFCNTDEVTHNVFSKSKANEFNIRTQAPGSSSVVEFNTAGVTEVRCAIHPSMKLVVTVEP